jgi:hypothetical protein
MNSFHACFSPSLALTIVYQWPCQHPRALSRLPSTLERVPGYGRQTGRGPLKITPSAGGDTCRLLWSRGWHLLLECPRNSPGEPLGRRVDPRSALALLFSSPHSSRSHGRSSGAADAKQPQCQRGSHRRLAAIPSAGDRRRSLSCRRLPLSGTGEAWPTMTPTTHATH